MEWVMIEKTLWLGEIVCIILGSFLCGFIITFAMWIYSKLPPKNN